MSAETVGRFLTVAEFAELVRISPRKVYALLAAREIAYHQHGDTYRIAEAEVASYLARTFVPTGPEGVAREAVTAPPPRSTYQERVA